MVKNSITPEEVVHLLNEALAIDKDAVSTVVMSRMNCNDVLADHETIQVSVAKGQRPAVSMLGLLNGMFGVYDDGPKKGHGPIRANYPDGGSWGRPTDFSLNPNV